MFCGAFFFSQRIAARPVSPILIDPVACDEPSSHGPRFCCALAAIPLAVSTLAHAEAGQPAAGSATVDLNETTVTAGSQRGFAASTAQVGAFRGMALRDIPATVNVVTREALDAQQDTSLYDALRNTAGVTRQQLSGKRSTTSPSGA
ncbi:TonB-dependent receptor plug domain-containing protein [Ralstonia sp. 1B3]